MIAKKLKKPKIRVVYRVIEDEVLCIFAGSYHRGSDRFDCYAHIGQHSGASYAYIMRGRGSRLATPEEYKALHSELTAIYNDAELVIGKRLYR